MHGQRHGFYETEKPRYGQAENERGEKIAVLRFINGAAAIKALLRTSFCAFFASFEATSKAQPRGKQAQR